MKDYAILLAVVGFLAMIGGVQIGRKSIRRDRR